MDIKKWNAMVTVEVPTTGQFRHIDSALEAIDCLYSCWPAPQGEAHRLAINACLAVLDDNRPTEASRDAFIAAARASFIEFKAEGGSIGKLINDLGETAGREDVEEFEDGRRLVS